jgi:ApbE superfamily uncharacterized protein (UPF0280 family)
VERLVMNKERRANVRTNENALLQQITSRRYDIDEWIALDPGLILSLVPIVSTA